MHLEGIWNGRSVLAALARCTLWPLSVLYAFGWRAYRAVYDLGLKTAREPHRPIVCIGNLTVGGSGKTPVAIHVVELLRELGFEVAISCSGYGSPASQEATVAPEGNMSARDWGDEPATDWRSEDETRAEGTPESAPRGSASRPSI